MKRRQWLSLSLACGLSGILAASCGGVVDSQLTSPSAHLDELLFTGYGESKESPADDGKYGSGKEEKDGEEGKADEETPQQGQQGQQGETGKAHGATCKELLADVEALQNKLVESPEWRALVATKEWEQTTADMKQFRDLNCSFGDDLSDECQAALDTLKRDNAQLEGTAEAKAVLESETYQKLLKARLAAQDKHCIASRQVRVFTLIGKVLGDGPDAGQQGDKEGNGSKEGSTGQDDPGQSQQGEQDQPAQPQEDACAQINENLTAHRADLQKTDEWKALTATEEWQQVEADADKLDALGCQQWDENPSEECQAAFKTLKKDFGKVKKTAEFKKAKKTKAWRVLQKDYAAAQAKHCFDKLAFFL